ncbi:MAG: hypothetical protein GY835_17140 [bacterium]|nr:hypothetical protein [bacterium]
MSLATRIRLQMLWLKHSWRFNWAHKPLCSRFAQDVLILGDIHLCRSCVCAWLGIIVGIVLSVPPAGRAIPAGGPLLGLLIPLLTLSAPGIYKRLPRGLRDILRFLAGALPPLSLAVALDGSSWIGAASLTTLLLFWRIYFHLRSDRKLRACAGCPQLDAESICDGFTLQATGARDYEQEASELVMRSGFRPF